MHLCGWFNYTFQCCSAPVTMLLFFTESGDYSVTVNLRLWNYGCLLRSQRGQLFPLRQRQENILNDIKIVEADGRITKRTLADLCAFYGKV